MSKCGKCLTVMPTRGASILFLLDPDLDPESHLKESESELRRSGSNLDPDPLFYLSMVAPEWRTQRPDVTIDHLIECDSN